MEPTERVSHVLSSALEITTGTDRAELLTLLATLAQAQQACLGAILALTVATAQREPEDDDVNVLSLPAAAQRLGLPLYTVREMSRQGELECIRRGARVFVSMAALKRFVRAREAPQAGLRPRTSRRAR
jgi:hypothetical protein